jgi:FKBP-type peptidyl-prolyl cis-trans isomerase FkpA
MQKNKKWIIAGIATLVLVLGSVFFFQSKKFHEVQDLEVKDLAVGTGAEAAIGKKITVHYSGWLTSGKKFDSSIDHNAPFSFELGTGRVIQGWDKGIVGMKVGGKRRLLIPPMLGYGSNGVGKLIPPNSTLVFEVDLLNVE